MASIQSVRFGVAARNTLRWPQKLRFNSARANAWRALLVAGREQAEAIEAPIAKIDHYSQQNRIETRLSSVRWARRPTGASRT